VLHGGAPVLYVANVTRSASDDVSGDPTAQLPPQGEGVVQ